MVWVAILTMGIMAFLFAALLAFADRRLKVVIDPRIEAINEGLPQANCGACGFPGCMGYATALVEKGAAPDRCAPGGQAAAEKIAAVLGRSGGPLVRRIARVHCRGGEDVTARKGVYDGIPSCRAAALVSGGDKVCHYGCLGYGDCAAACTFQAITMGADGLPRIDEAACTGCGQCLRVCPKQILELHPAQQNVLVFCRSHDTPKVSRALCRHACIGCGICARACPAGAVEIQENLAVIRNPAAVGADCQAGLAKCPTGAIGFIRGVEPGSTAQTQ